MPLPFIKEPEFTLAHCPVFGSIPVDGLQGRRFIWRSKKVRTASALFYWVIVKAILRKYGYPPDKQEKATQTVLEQAEVLCKEWAA
jgi:hypothetical protein